MSGALQLGPGGRVFSPIALSIDNALQPETLVRIPRKQWPSLATDPGDRPREVWRSRDFLLLVYPAPNNVERLTICRTSIDSATARFADGISWEQLQRLKGECGRGDREAVEVFPRDRDIVNIANLRHLWVLPHGLPFTWVTER